MATLSLADARAKARQLLADPSTLAPREELKVETVESAAEEFARRHVLPTRRERSAREAVAQLRREFVRYHADWPGSRSVGATSCGAWTRWSIAARP